MKLALIAHGSGSNPHAAAGVWELAARVGAEAYFLRQEPRLEALHTAKEPVLAVPLLAGHGYFADQVIPEMLHGMDHVRVTPPLGTYAKTADYLAEQISALAPKGPVSVFLLSHGTKRPNNAPKESAHALAARLSGQFSQVEALFLEQEPFAYEWPQRVRHNHVVIVPLTVLNGVHGGTDIPALFLSPEDLRVDVAKGLTAGPDMAGLVMSLAAEFGYAPDFQ